MSRRRGGRGERPNGSIRKITLVQMCHKSFSLGGSSSGRTPREKTYLRDDFCVTE